MKQLPSLAGRWKRQGARSSRSGDAAYPDVLEFKPNNLYTGTPASPGDYVVWDVGRYQVEDADRVKLSTANDAEISYKFKLTGDDLTVEDGQGVQLHYKRVKS